MMNKILFGKYQESFWANEPFIDRSNDIINIIDITLNGHYKPLILHPGHTTIITKRKNESISYKNALRLLIRLFLPILNKQKLTLNTVVGVIIIFDSAHNIIFKIRFINEYNFSDFVLEEEYITSEKQTKEYKFIKDLINFLLNKYKSQLLEKEKNSILLVIEDIFKNEIFKNLFYSNILKVGFDIETDFLNTIGNYPLDLFSEKTFYGKEDSIEAESTFYNCSQLMELIDEIIKYKIYDEKESKIHLIKNSFK